MEDFVILRHPNSWCGGNGKLTNYFVLIASTEAMNAYYDFLGFLEKNPGHSTEQFDTELTKCVNAIRRDYHESKKYAGIKKVYRISLNNASSSETTGKHLDE